MRLNHKYKTMAYQRHISPRTKSVTQDSTVGQILRVQNYKKFCIAFHPYTFQ